jgi:hypothetical protein
MGVKSDSCDIRSRVIYSKKKKHLISQIRCQTCVTITKMKVCINRFLDIINLSQWLNMQAFKTSIIIENHCLRSKKLNVNQF